MTNSKTTKRALLTSVMALVLCFAMLTGTTFAWFTDTETSSGNKIVAGNLDVQLLMWDGDSYEEITDESAPIFGANSLIAQNNPADTLWEPGKTQVAYLAIRNAGNLALKYNVIVDVENNGLIGALEYAIVPMADGVTADTSLGTDWATIEALEGIDTGFLAAGKTIAAPDGCLDEVRNGYEQNKNETDYFALVIHMDENAGNEYKSDDQEKNVVIDIIVNAAQVEAEADAFSNEYDKNAEYDILVFTAEELYELALTATGDVKFALANDITLGNDTEVCYAVNFANATSVTIDGNNHSITFKGKAPVRVDSPITSVAGILSAGDITVKDVTLVNDKLSYEGKKTSGDRPQVYTTIRGTSVTYENVIFDGGVQVKGNETFKGCTFTESVLTTDGDGFAMDGRFCMFIDHEYDQDGTYEITLEDCTFNASGYGCVKVAGDKGANITVNVKGCTFYNTCPSNSWSQDTPKYDVKATGANVTVNNQGGNTWGVGLENN